MMPCRKNKCILQSVCRDKKVIYCDDFMQYIENKYKANSQSVNSCSPGLHRKIWMRLTRHHPNLLRVSGDRNQEDMVEYTIYRHS